MEALRRRWENRKYKRWRDLPIRATFVLYTLAAFLAGTAVCLVVIMLCNRVRIDLQNKYAELSVSHEVPELGSYDVHRTGRIVTVHIYDENDAEVERFIVNLREETLAYDAEIRASYLGEDAAPEGGVYMGSYYQPHGFVVTPRYTGEDAYWNIAAVTISIVIIPVAYIGALILCSALFFRRKLRPPIALLKRSSDRIARSDLDFTAAYDSRDEMGQLCDSFETMRGALERNNREMWRGIEERKRLNAAFSHDLRTPLTVLKGRASMLRAALAEGDPDPEEVSAELDAMSGSIERLERYAEAMTRLQRLEDVEVRRADVPVADLAAALQDTANILCAGRALRFDVPAGGTARVDWEIVLQVAENLLSNGARYARSALDVALRLDGDALELRVRDDGPGFSPTDLQKAAEPFYRGKSAGAGEGHLGLGLNICRVLCQRHGGDLKLENDGGGCVTARFGME